MRWKNEDHLHDFIPAVSTTHGVVAITRDEVSDATVRESTGIDAVGEFAVVVHADVALEWAATFLDTELVGAVSGIPLVYAFSTLGSR